LTVLRVRLRKIVINYEQILIIAFRKFLRFNGNGKGDDEISLQLIKVMARAIEGMEVNLFRLRLRFLQNAVNQEGISSEA
jgi:hypothetical protein